MFTLLNKKLVILCIKKITLLTFFLSFHTWMWTDPSFRYAGISDRTAAVSLAYLGAAQRAPTHTHTHDKGLGHFNLFSTIQFQCLNNLKAQEFIALWEWVHALLCYYNIITSVAQNVFKMTHICIKTLINLFLPLGQYIVKNMLSW